MSDNRTTELLMREFVDDACECEVRDYLISEYAERIEQAIAATLGGGKLTAEQVREAIKRHSTELLGGHRVFIESDWQATADELNARAERTCRNTHENRWFKCSACGYGFTDLYAEDESDINEQPRYCPNCGSRVVE